jgi:hypothetical protein
MFSGMAMIRKISLYNYTAISVGLLLLAISGYQFVVTTTHRQLQDELQQWSNRSFDNEQYSSWESKRLLVDVLTDLAPYSGNAAQNSSRFYLFGSAIAGLSLPEAAIENINQALALIRQSILNQPTWPLAWMDLAYIKSLMGVFDEEFQQAFAKALQTGGNETHVLTTFTEIGFATWRDLTADNRRLFLKMLDVAVVRNRKSVTEVAERYERKYILCLMLQVKEPLKGYCQG